MEFKDLEKKLENIKTPEIEIQSHQRRLRLVLLSSGCFKEKPIMSYTKRLVPVGVALALILVVGFTVINPKLQMAQAMEIAKNDPQIQQLMEDYGVEIKQVKLLDGKAYVLLTLSEEKLPSELEERILDAEGEIIESSGSVVEIDLKAKKVRKIELIEKQKEEIMARMNTLFREEFGGTLKAIRQRQEDQGCGKWEAVEMIETATGEKVTERMWKTISSEGICEELEAEEQRATDEYKTKKEELYSLLKEI